MHLNGSCEFSPKENMDLTDTKNLVLNDLRIWMEGKDTLKSLPFVVTGSSGFIGSNLVFTLSSLGFHGIGLDLEFPNDIQQRLNTSPNFQFLKVNLCDINHVKEVSKKLPEKFILIHLASPNTEHTASKNKNNKKRFIGFSDQIGLELDIATSLTSVLCEKAVFVIYGSSIDIFGSRPPITNDTLINEDTHPFPDSPYGFGKLLSESIFREEFSTRDIPLSIFRLPQIYGDYEFLFYERAIPVFLNCILDKKAITIIGKTQESRQYLHCNDVVLAFLKSIYSSYEGTLQLSGEAVPLYQLLDTLQKITGEVIPRNFSPDQQEPQYGYKLSSYKAAGKIGFKQTVSLEYGLRSALFVARAAR